MHPIVQRLTPPPGDRPTPEWLQSLRLPLSQSLPTPLSLPGLDLTLLLVIPSARVRHWLAMPPDTVVAQGSTQSLLQADAVPRDDPRDTLAPALVFTRGRSLVARLPLRLHARTLLPRTGAGDNAGAPLPAPRDVALELVVLGFSLTAQALSGPGAGSSFVELAWRRIDRGTDAFMPPVARPALRQRLVATTGLGGDRGKRRLDAAPISAGSDDTATRGLRGGLQWRLTHD